MLHDNDLRPIVSDDGLGIHERPRQGSSNKGEDEEANVGAIRDGGVSFLVDVFAEGNLCHNVSRIEPRKEYFWQLRSRHTKLPITAPRLKIIQNHEMYRPLEASGG